MPTKKKPTEQELKDRLWEMAITVDFGDGTIADIESHPDYNEWDDDMIKRPVRTVKVPGFEGSTTDLNKIRNEVENSCLTEKCKKSLLDALKKAK